LGRGGEEGRETENVNSHNRYVLFNIQCRVELIFGEEQKCVQDIHTHSHSSGIYIHHNKKLKIYKLCKLYICRDIYIIGYTSLVSYVITLINYLVYYIDLVVDNIMSTFFSKSKLIIF